MASSIAQVLSLAPSAVPQAHGTPHGLWGWVLFGVVAVVIVGVVAVRLTRRRR